MKQKMLSAIKIGSFAVAGLIAVMQVTAVQAAPQRPGPPTVVGLWEQVDDDGKVGGWFHIYERDGIFEGKIVKMFPKPGDKPNPICTQCPGDQKNQPSLGLTLIKNMQRSGRNFDKGTIMDPRDGSVYQARMELSPDGQQLMVRGFLGIDLFGKSQTWRRLPESAMTEIAPLPGAGVPGTSKPAQPAKR